MATDYGSNEIPEQHESSFPLKSTILFLLILSALPHSDEHKYKADKEHRQAEKPTVIGIHPTDKYKQYNYTDS
jgi:hypothetical protein